MLMVQVGAVGWGLQQSAETSPRCNAPEATSVAACIPPSLPPSRSLASAPHFVAPHTHDCQPTDERNPKSGCQFLVSWSSNKTKHVQRQ